MIPRARDVRFRKLGLLQVAFAACLASCAGGGSTSSSVMPSQANAANVSTTLPGSQIVALAPPGNSSAAVAEAPATASREPVPVTFRFALPSTQTQTALRRKQDVGYSGGYVSPAFTPSISLTVTPLEGAAVGPFTGTCTSGTSGNCTVSFTAVPGPTTFSGTISENGNVISQFSQTQIIQPSSANTIRFTANPVVSSISLALSAPTTYLNTTLGITLPAVTAGSPADVSLVVNALDANGQTISGVSQYVDANGAPLSIVLGVANRQNGGSGNITIQGPIRISGPNQPSIRLHYDGKWLDFSTVTASVSSPSGIPSATATVSTVPTITTRSPVMPSGSYLWCITTGPDGNLWFTDGGLSTIGKLSTDGVMTLYTAGISSSAQPIGITAGPDGNLWFIEYNPRKVGRITTAGYVTEFSGMTAFQPRMIRSGPDGNLWFTQQLGNKIGSITTNGVIRNFSVSGSSPQALVTGADGALWVAYSGTTKLSRLSISGQETSYAFSGATGGYFNGITVGGDGNIWFIDPSSKAIGKYDFSSNSVTTYTAGISANAGIRDITIGPDGNVWFTEQSSKKIASITPSGKVNEYGTVNGFSGGSDPNGLILGPDGNIWVVEAGLKVVGRFVY